MESTNGRYTVRDGDTLAGIAAAQWGDASLWYMIAEANGLTGAQALAAGTSLVIPAKVVNVHNNARTFEVYDPNRALGDLSPTAPKPPKKANKCGAFGAILLAVVAVAVTAILRVPVTNFIAGALKGAGVALGSAAAGAGVTIAGGVVAGAAGSIASQGFGLASGIQDRFSWKGVAMAGIGGGVGGALGSGGLFGKLGAFGGVGDAFAQGLLSGAAGNAAIQGIGLAMGLQSKFDWAGVAAASIGGGVSNGVGARLGGGFGASLAANTAGGIANAAARSLANGTSFGDNIIAALPDLIGTTIGNLVASGVAARPSAASISDREAIIADKEARSAAIIASKEALAAQIIAQKSGQPHDLLVDVEATLYPQLAAAGPVTGITPNEVQARIRNLRPFLTPDEWDAANSQYATNLPTMGRDRAFETALSSISNAIDARGLDSSLLSEIEIDWNFIRDREGFRRDAYWVADPSNPRQAHPNSGVTIGTGFDLGRRTTAELTAMGIPQALVTKLTPYLGARGQAARQLVTQRPLVLSQREADTLDALMRGRKAMSVAQVYNSRSSVRFQDLPSGYQTVIASVHFQYGSIAATPQFMRQVTSQQWQPAIQNLRNFGDAFGRRRNIEADLMNQTFQATQPRRTP